MLQSISSMPLFLRNSFVFEKWWFPKKPLNAESGLGWTEVSTRCFGFVIYTALFLAFAPQRMKTTGFSRWLSRDITESVNFSQPFPLWLLAWPARTVRTELSSRTPSFAHLVRSPCFPRLSMPVSAFISLNILTSDGGTATPFWTEKLRPWAWLGPW